MPTTPMDQIPAGWQQHTSSKTGKIYYFNPYTGQSVYEKPTEDALPTGWSKHLSTKTGKWYYFNSATNESRFDPPPLPSAHGGNQPQQNQAVVQSVPNARSFVPSALPASATAVDAATALKVASAYDSLADRGRAGRQQSSILHLKNLNNWVKAVLISGHTARPCGRVLDLACGKLGDFQKWRMAGVYRYCGIDISRQAVEDATARFVEGAATVSGLEAKFIRADLGAVDLSRAGVLEETEQFDAISIQFALHYLFQTEQRALTFFRNIANRLAPGGVFLGTIPDAAVLVRRLRDLQPGGPPATGQVAPQQLKFGNTHYSVEFTPASSFAQWRIGNHPYGIRYTFYLAESVDKVDEYLVPWELLERLAASVGLVPIANDNFHDFFARMTGAEGSNVDPSLAAEHRSLLSKMGVLDVSGSLSPDEWAVAGLYRVFAFRAPMQGARVSESLPDMDTIHPEWEKQEAVPLRAHYRRAPTVANIVDLLAGQA